MRPLNEIDACEIKENLQCESCKKFKLNKNYVPLPIYEGDEIYPNGIFKLLPYFKDVRGYTAYVEYWNQKIKDMEQDEKRYAKMRLI